MIMQKARCIINAYLRALSILAASANPFQDTATIFIARPIVIRKRIGTEVYFVAF